MEDDYIFPNEIALSISSAGGEIEILEGDKPTKDYLNGRSFTKLIKNLQNHNVFDDDNQSENVLHKIEKSKMENFLKNLKEKIFPDFLNVSTIKKLDALKTEYSHAKVKIVK